jgi:putative hydrolase of the HAD superfamily
MLDRKNDFYRYFDRVFNSYNLGITKKEPQIFDLVLEEMDESPENTLFADDHNPHIERASQKKINAVLFKDLNDFKKKIKEEYFEDAQF